MTKSPKNGQAKRTAYDTIKHLIMTAELPPGQPVTEVGLSKQLGISRTPVREACVDLEQEGLIVTTNRRKRVYMLSVREVEDLFELKGEIEGAVARWATLRGSDEQFKRLTSIIKQMNGVAAKRPTDESKESLWLQRWLDLDAKLHNTLFDAAGNQRAQQTITGLNIQWHQLKVGILTMEGRVEKSAGEHQRIVEAVCTGKPVVARKHMQTHLQNLKRELVKIMKFAHYPNR